VPRSWQEGKKKKKQRGWGILSTWNGTGRKTPSIAGPGRACKLQAGEASAGVMNETVGEMVQSRCWFVCAVGFGCPSPLSSLHRINRKKKKSISTASRSSVRLLFGLSVPWAGAWWTRARRCRVTGAQYLRPPPAAANLCLSTSTWSSADGCQAVRWSRLCASASGVWTARSNSARPPARPQAS
jgi:hypothetical protein